MLRVFYDWPTIQAFYDSGRGFEECRLHFGFSASSWYKAIFRGRIVLRPADHERLKSRGPGNPQYDWAAVQSFYDAGHSYRECRETFGFSAGSWTKAVRRGALRARARQWPLADVIARAKCRTHLKNRLLQAGVLANCCEGCGISDWRGRSIAIQIDHVNGDRHDNRLENLRMLCPNCHSQTDTWGSRNRKSIPSSLAGRAPDSESGGPSFESKLGSNGPIV